jgi:hypothetical protein
VRLMVGLAVSPAELLYSANSSSAPTRGDLQHGDACVYDDVQIVKGQYVILSIWHYML